MSPLPNRAYDVIKWIALLVIPTLVGALVALQEIWSLPISENLVATLTGISGAIGAMLTVSSLLYYNKSGVQIPSMPVKVYKILQDMTLYWLPTFATAYYLLSLFVHVHYAVPVVESAIVIQVFLGLILGTYSSQTGDLKQWVQIMLDALKARVADVISGQQKQQ